jgi:hypothetical protein
MTARIERARVLLGELEVLACALGEATEPDIAALFLDRLVRCRGFSPEEVAEAGATETLAACEAAAARTLETLGGAAGQGLDLEQLWDRGLALARGTDDAGCGEWGQDLLLVANVTEFVPGTRGERMQEVVERCLALAAAFPERLQAVAEVAADRAEQEGIETLGPFAADIHRCLVELPLLMAVDASEVQPDPVALGALVASVARIVAGRRADIPQDDEPWTVKLVRCPTPAAEHPGTTPWGRIAAYADSAIADAIAWRDELAALLALGLRAGVPGECARDGSVKLGSRAGAEWSIVASGGSLFLEGCPSPHATVMAQAGSAGRALDRVVGRPERWVLPPQAEWKQGLRLEVTVGPDSFAFDLPGESRG